MTVQIEPVNRIKIVDLITTFGPILTKRQADLLDYCQALSGNVWSAYVGDDLVCCWGLIPPTFLSNKAYLWMYATDAVKDHQFLLVRHSQRVVERMLEVYDTINGHCKIGADESIRWLKWLGAEFGPPEGTNVPFVIRKKHG